MATSKRMMCHCPECGTEFQLLPPATVVAYLERNGWERYPESKEPSGHYFHVHPEFGPRSYPKAMHKGYGARFLVFLSEQAENEGRSMIEILNDARGAAS